MITSIAYFIRERQWEASYGGGRLLSGAHDSWSFCPRAACSAATWRERHGNLNKHLMRRNQKETAAAAAAVNWLGTCEPPGAGASCLVYISCINMDRKAANLHFLLHFLLLLFSPDPPSDLLPFPHSPTAPSPTLRSSKPFPCPTWTTTATACRSCPCTTRPPPSTRHPACRLAPSRPRGSSTHPPFPGMH